MFFRKLPAALEAISTLVSVGKMRIAPMSARFNPPLRHSMGSSHFGSAFLLRPMSSRNQTASGIGSLWERAPLPGGPGSNSRGPRRSGAWPGSDTSSASGRRARNTRASAVAIFSAPSSVSSRWAISLSSSVGSSLSSGSCNRRRRSSWRISSALGGAAHSTSTLGPGDQAFGAAAGLGRNQQDADALAAGAAGAARAMLQRLGVMGQFGVDDEAEAGQVDAARRDIGGDADPRPAVAQRLHRQVAFVLAQFAGQQGGGKAALLQGGLQMAHRSRGCCRTRGRSASRRSAAD